MGLSSNEAKIINTAIAVQVFGHDVHETRWGKQKQHSCLTIGPPDYYDDAGEMKLFNALPDYCGNIEAAFSIVGAMPYSMELTSNAPFELRDVHADWFCTFDGREYAYAATPAEAICRAALLIKSPK